ncbi:MAG: DUF3079 domain-containing protein [Pseudomonadota bacterium]|nr:DUF3079 domain-containing protein [Pseudomonadota bacterium]
MAKRFPIHPAHPERICWGCDKYCPADDLACGNGSDRTQHPVELFGPDWAEWTPPVADGAAHTAAGAPDDADSFDPSLHAPVPKGGAAS